MAFFVELPTHYGDRGESGENKTNMTTVIKLCLEEANLSESILGPGDMMAARSLFTFDRKQ